MANGNGPLGAYAPPGVYTRTLQENNLTNVVANLRIPEIIGVGQEELEQLDLEMVRGSSSFIDQQITAEDVTLSWVVDNTNPNNLLLGAQDGTRTTFRVRNYPLVDGQGIGRITNDIRSVSVTVNGLPVALGSVQGRTGLVTLQIPTQPTDIVRCTYFFHRGDTSFTDDLSNQVTADNAVLVSPGVEPFDIQTGSSDTFVFEINGAQASVTFAADSATTALSLKGQLDAAQISGLSTAVFVDNQGLSHLQLTASVSLKILSGNANGPLAFTANTQTSRNAVFRVYNRPIVDGSSGGITTTDPSKVVVKVNNIQTVPTAVDGSNGTVTLASPPAPGSKVTVQYYANTWQDTFDYLPNTLVTTVLRCGISEGRNDYIQGQDFVISNPSSDVSIINWGTGSSVTSGTTTVGATPFNENQIIPTLVDSQLFLAACQPVTDTTVIPAVVSTTEFLLPEIPTLGNGRNTPLGQSTYDSVANGRIDLTSNRPDLVTVRSGRNLRDAMNRAALTVTEVDGASRKITLQSPVPPDHNVYATFYYNKISDDTFIMTSVTPGPVGSGQYTIFSTSLNQNLYQVKFGTKAGLTQTVQWPRGTEQVPDATHTGGGTAVSETVTVTFGQNAASNAAYTNKGAGPWSFYSASNTWVTKLNGTNYTTNLTTPRQGYLVSRRVPVNGSNQINISATDNELNLTIDDEAVTVTLTSGLRTAAQILTEINAAIDAVPAFNGTAPNNLANSYQVGGSGGDVFFVIKSYATPAVLPGGFDDVSYVKIDQGTVETTLGFNTFQRADGTAQALNKPATLLGSLAETFAITTGVNDKFVIRVDGIDYTITLPSGGAVTAASVVATINAVSGLSGVGSVGTGANLGKVRLTSTTNAPQSQILILGGNANSTLGFTEGDFASQTLVNPQEVVDALLGTAGFLSAGMAYVSTINGSSYLTIESLTTGAASSSVAFVSGSNSAFNTTTGVKITPGTDGDVGEDAQDKFTVTSNNPDGSAGTGTPGQTYTDATTGLRFTILPSTVGGYDLGGTFTLLISPTFDVTPSVPRYAVAGLELIVSNTVGVPANDTASLQTFNPGGLEPAVGDFYYVSYRYMKQDFSTRLFQQIKTIEANFGRTSAENRLTLSAYLSILNGALLVALKQVLKVPNGAQASDQAFITAIQEAATPLPGNIRPNIIMPSVASTQVYNFLTNHCEVQSNIRNQSERIGFIGFASGTTPTQAQAVARGLISNRIVAFYPDSAVIPLTDELGNTFEALVDGTFMAAAATGAIVSPSVDVATPYTRRRIVGFSRIPRILDPVEANQTATSGITILEDLGTVIRIRQGLTTNVATVLTKLPTVTQIADFIQQQTRVTLDPYVGNKYLASKTTDVEVSMTSFLKAQIQAEIIAAFTGVSASPNADDVTTLDVAAAYSPIFPLLYLFTTFSLRSRL